MQVVASTQTDHILMQRCSKFIASYNIVVQVLYVFNLALYYNKYVPREFFSLKPGCIHASAHSFLFFSFQTVAFQHGRVYCR